MTKVPGAGSEEAGGGFMTRPETLDDVSSARMTISSVEPSTVSSAVAGVLTFVTGSQYVGVQSRRPPTRPNAAIPVAGVDRDPVAERELVR